uniref:Protein windpipe n=1 Tax=Cacopsylla melanoneura TaxID=428564 RepID=A0A8D8PLT5_9HEMI
MAIPAVTTAALLSAPLVVLLFVFGTMVTSAPTELCLDGCICYNDIRNQKLKSQKTVNCTSFRPILTAASSLLSDFSHVEVLNVQNVMDGSSEVIFEGLFKVFPNVKYMNLINASISKIIDENAFKGLKQLEVLDLSRNYIYKFRPDTFIETPKLRVLDLSYNPLRLAPTTFLVSKSLEDLILSSCNLTIVPAGSFKGIPNLKVLDLYDNQIQSFTIRSFPRSLKHLWLTKNNVTNVPTKALSSLNKLTSLDLSENPINCTCSLIGLQDWFSSKGVIFENDVICSYPSEYKGESWRHVFENDVCVESVEIETTSISKQEDTSELSSCANEICDENMSDDRYIYNNAIQADQPNTEIVTEHNPVNELEKNVEDFTITPSSPVTANDVSAVNIIEPITEKNVLDASDDSKMNESKNLVEDITNNNDTQVMHQMHQIINDASNLDNFDSKLSESKGESQNDDGQSFPESSQSSEILKDDPVTTVSSVVTDLLSDTKRVSTGETQLDYIQTPMDLSDSTSSPETQPPAVPLSIETTTLKSDPDFSQVKDIDNDNQPVLTTTEEIISAINVFNELSAETSSETPTTIVNVERDTVTTTVDPLSLIETTSLAPVQSTESNDSPASTTQSDVLLSVGGISENTTSTPSITTIIPSTSTSEASTTTDVPTTAEPSTTTTEVVLPVNEIGKSDNEVTTTSASTPITESTESNTPSVAWIENKDSNVETTSTSSTESTTPIPPPLLSSEKTNDVPNSKEETTVPTSTTEKQEIFVDPTNKTEAIVVLPSTDNRKGKMLSSTENDDQKPPESMGSYIVLAGIIIVLLLLILYATTKNSKRSSNNKIPLKDADHNMTELQDMATLLPSSPPVNGNKNYKYPDEEPSVTAKLLEPVDDQSESNGNGFVYPQENKLNRPQVQEKAQESNGKSTLPRTNGSSPNVAPPLELTTAKVLVMPDSLPRKPIYVQKNVNS